MAGAGKEVEKSDEQKRGGSCSLPVKVLNSPAQLSHVEETARGSVQNSSSTWDCLERTFGAEYLLEMAKKVSRCPRDKDGSCDEGDGITAVMSNPKLGAASLKSASTGGGSHTLEKTISKSSQVPKPTLPLQRGKKLLVLNLIGFLVARPPSTRVVSKRPFCDAFLEYCFENFHVGIWSSVTDYNAHKILDSICKGTKPKLAFIMSQSDCTETGLMVPGNRRFRPLFLKELTKVWARFRSGEFNASNTLLVDDSPHKAIRNPPFTAIFPETYGSHNVDDTFLAGTFRVFLEGLRDAADVQDFVKRHPIGMPPITEESPDWNFYKKISTLDDLSSQMSNVSMSEKQHPHPSNNPPRDDEQTYKAPNLIFKFPNFIFK